MQVKIYKIFCYKFLKAIAFMKNIQCAVDYNNRYQICRIAGIYCGQFLCLVCSLNKCLTKIHTMQGLQNYTIESLKHT